MEKNTYNILHPVYSTQLYSISRTAIDWAYILKDERVIEILDTAPKDLREQTIELFYKTMIGISLYFQSKKDKDLETIKTYYPNLPTILKQMIKEGVERGELYIMEYMNSINNYPSEYDNNSATYKAATADIVMELEKLGDDTAQPQQRKAKQTPSFKSLLLRGDDEKQQQIIERIHKLVKGKDLDPEDISNIIQSLINEGYINVGAGSFPKLARAWVAEFEPNRIAKTLENSFRHHTIGTDAFRRKNEQDIRNYQEIIFE